MIQHFPCMCKALGLITVTTKVILIFTIMHAEDVWEAGKNTKWSSLWKTMSVSYWHVTIPYDTEKSLLGIYFKQMFCCLYKNPSANISNGSIYEIPKLKQTVSLSLWDKQQWPKGRPVPWKGLWSSLRILQTDGNSLCTHPGIRAWDIHVHCALWDLCNLLQKGPEMHSLPLSHPCLHSFPTPARAKCFLPPENAHPLTFLWATAMDSSILTKEASRSKTSKIALHITPAFHDFLPELILSTLRSPKDYWGGSNWLFSGPGIELPAQWAKNHQERSLASKHCLGS